MGRIVAFVTIENPSEGNHRIECDALVDTGASHMVLPSAWRKRLGEFHEFGDVELETADQRSLTGTVCGPVQIQIEGFRPVFSEVVFVDMNPDDGKYDPLVGYLGLQLTF